MTQVSGSSDRAAASPHPFAHQARLPPILARVSTEAASAGLPYAGSVRPREA